MFKINAKCFKLLLFVSFLCYLIFYFVKMSYSIFLFIFLVVLVHWIISYVCFSLASCAFGLTILWLLINNIKMKWSLCVKLQRGLWSLHKMEIWLDHSFWTEGSKHQGVCFRNDYAFLGSVHTVFKMERIPRKGAHTSCDQILEMLSTKLHHHK